MQKADTTTFKHVHLCQRVECDRFYRTYDLAQQTCPRCTAPSKEKR